MKSSRESANLNIKIVRFHFIANARKNKIAKLIFFNFIFRRKNENCRTNGASIFIDEFAKQTRFLLCAYAHVKKFKSKIKIVLLNFFRRKNEIAFDFRLARKN